MPRKINKADAQYAYNIVKKICTEVGPGLPGSIQEKERANIIKKEFESHLGLENVVVEEFTLAPGALLSPMPISAILILLAAMLNISIGQFMGISPWVTTIAALVFSVIPLLLYIFEFLLGFELIDLFFKKKQSVNVIGTLRKHGNKKVRRLLILSGHHDSALEFTWVNLFGYGFIILYATMFMGLFTMIVMSIIQLMGIMTANADLVRVGTLSWIMLAYPIVPSIVIALFFTRGKKNGGVVPGAVDNLAASALAVAMCRFLVKNTSNIPAETEIRFISFGGEEAGLRGSRRYVKRHMEELKRLDVRMLNFEMVAYPEIIILNSDVHGTVKNSPEMVSSVVAAAYRAGVPFKVKPASLSVGTDAASFSKAGFKATTLLPFKAPQQMVEFYHQRQDGPDVLSIEPLLNVLKLTYEWIRNGGK